MKTKDIVPELFEVAELADQNRGLLNVEKLLELSVYGMNLGTPS